jgi:hypothetical protein
MVDAGTKNPEGGQAGPRVPSMASPTTIKLRCIVQSVFSLHLAIGLGMVASARFAWLYSHVEKDTPPPALALLLFELPLIFCLLPFVTGGDSNRNARSAGMVFGTTVGFCPLLLVLIAGAVATFGGKAELASFLPICFVAALWMLGVSWWWGSGDRREFIASAKWGILGFLLVSLLVALASL